MSNKSLFGSESHFANIGSWKAGSPTSNPQRLKAQSRQLFIGLQQSHSTTESTITALQQILETITPWPNPLLLCIGHAFLTFFFFSAAATKGWAWCSHNEMQSWRTYCRSRELKLLVGIAGLDFKKGSKGMDFLDKHVEQISFRHCVTFCEHGQLKGWQPHFQPTVAKSSISTTVRWFAAVT